MNTLEYTMVELLKKMKKEYGVEEVKTEFESEGARLNEVMRLKDIATRAGLGLVFKIGGPEAVTDIFFARDLGATSIIAPMVESAYALKKYVDLIARHFDADERDDITFGVNIETIQAFDHLADILALPSKKQIKRITVGRVDLVGSMGLSRSEINTDTVFDVVQNIFLAAKKKGYQATMGGGIDQNTTKYIQALVKRKLLDSYETRKIVFPGITDKSKIEKGIVLANQFELYWLENKQRYAKRVAMEDDDRIMMLRKRVK